MRSLAALCAFLLCIALVTPVIAEDSDNQYVLITRREYDEAYYGIYRKTTTEEEFDELTEAAKNYIREHYDVAFAWRETQNTRYRLLGFRSGLVFEFNSKYPGVCEYGEIVKGDLDSGFVIQWDDYDHTVTYKYIPDDKHLHIIDYYTGNEFDSSYVKRDIETAIEVYYPSKRH